MCYENTGSSKNGGSQALQLRLNVLVGSVCEGCRFCEFPYTFDSIIRNDDGKFSEITINDTDDLWKYIYKLKSESENNPRLQGRGSTDIALDICEQLPFFACKNRLFNKELIYDIRKYNYCKESGQMPYSGAYGDTPAIWIEKFFIIRDTLIGYENKLKKQQEQEYKQKSKLK